MKRRRQLLGIALALITSVALAASDLTSVKLGVHEILQIRGKDGTALVDFTSIGQQEDESLYRWRFVSTTGAETSGGGNVFERYERKWTSTTNCLVEDLGSRLTVHAGPYEIKWSYGEADAFGWLYVDTNTLQIMVLPDAEFATNEWMRCETIGVALWMIVSVTLIISLWRHHPEDRIIKKILWTLILCLPVIGWVFYGGFYDPPWEGPSKTGSGDSGWDVQGAGY